MLVALVGFCSTVAYENIMTGRVFISMHLL